MPSSIAISSRASDPRRIALTSVELADLLGISRAHVWRLLAGGKLPQPVRLGRSVRWDRWTIEEWMAAGAPPRERWEEMQRNQSA